MRIAVVVNSRANYGRIKSFLERSLNYQSLDVKVIAGASALLAKYGRVVDIIKEDGFEVAAELDSIIEGDEPIHMAKSTGLGIIETSTALKNLKPDSVLTIADRYETLSTAVAASYMNIPVIHTQGGDQTGSIDESVRHAITKLSHIHFPASEKSRERIISMGENPEFVFNVGCPSIDLIKNTNLSYTEGVFQNAKGIGENIDFSKPYVVVLMHPITTKNKETYETINQLLEAIKKLSELNLQIVWLWPNIDAGGELVSKAIRTSRESNELKNVHLYKNFPPDQYLVLINNCKCLIGNSSSGLREGAFLGVPVVNIGSRQQFRESSSNVINVDSNYLEIFNAAIKQIEYGKYPSSKHLGDGDSGEKMCKILSEITLPSPQKKLYL
tara:strand:- start:12188 stop:13342 length:1155 start_codon:yes stop_codon:yes gene_type:complete